MAEMFDFMMIGAQKGGTTWLYDLMSRIEGISGTSPKETQLLSNPAMQCELNQMTRDELGARFEEAFGHAKAGDLRFEATPATIARPFAADHVKRFAVSRRFIVTLREPTERIESLWAMWQRRRFKKQNLSYAFQDYWQPAIEWFQGQLEIRDERIAEVKKGLALHSSDSVDLSAAMITVNLDWYSELLNRVLKLKADPESRNSRLAILVGLYVVQLSYWHKLFDPSAFFVLRTQDLNDLDVLVEMIRFAGRQDIEIAEVEKAKRQTTIVNKNLSDPLPQEFLEPFRELYKPFNDQLGRDFGIWFN